MVDSKHLPVIGWREWIALPDLNVRHIKAKVDSGARSSSLHASDITPFQRGGRTWVRFTMHPMQGSTKRALNIEHAVLEYRKVRSSSGKETLRPVIVTDIKLLGTVWPIALTLADREAMGFRMLLGREAFRNRFLLDAGQSYRGGRPVLRSAKKKL